MCSGKTALAVIGSARRNGTVDSAVSELIKSLEKRGFKCRKIYLSDLKIEFCTNCRTCLQQPDKNRGICILDDDMNNLLDDIEANDYLILGAPTSFGNVNALTQKFIERCICYAYWPWGQLSPKLRNNNKDKKSVLISSSAAPAFMAKYLSRTSKTLRTLSGLLGAQPVKTLRIGKVIYKEISISDKFKKQADSAAEKLSKKAAF
jgi:multimeric flavodoxin WrbA